MYRGVNLLFEAMCACVCVCICVCADVKTKRKVLDNYHAVILVVDVTHKQKCLTSEPVCVCLSLHVSPSVCQWVIVRTRERERIKSD